MNTQNTQSAAVESLRTYQIISFCEDVETYAGGGGSTAITLQAGGKRSMPLVKSTGHSRQSLATTYDSTLGLYYVANTTSSGGVISFYGNSNGTQLVDTATVTVSAPGNYPSTTTVLFNPATTSSTDISGSVSVTLNDSSQTSGLAQFDNLSDGQGDVISGSFTNNAVDSGSGALSVTTGTVSFTDSLSLTPATLGGGTTAEQIAFSGTLADYTATANISTSGVTSGELIANSITEMYSFQVNPNGSGSITNSSTGANQTFQILPTTITV